MRMGQSGPRGGDFSLYKSPSPDQLGRADSVSTDGWGYQADRSRPRLSTQRGPPCWRGFLALCVLTALLFHSCAASQLSCLDCVRFPSLLHPKFGIPVGTKGHQPSVDRWSPAVCVLSSSPGASPVKYQSSRLCFLPECSVDACSAYHPRNGFSLALLPPSVAHSMCV